MNAKKLGIFIIIFLSLGVFNMPPIRGVTTTTETIQIANPDDDLFTLDGGAQTGTNIIIFRHPDFDTKAFIRFRNVVVEQNAVITSAILSVYRGTAETTGTAIWATIYGIAEDDCPQFEQPDHTGPIQTNYPLTQNFYTWDTSTFGAGWHNVTITGVVAAIIGRLNWESGNDLGLQFLAAEGGAVTRAFWSYEYGPTLSAKLYITYTVGAPDVDEPGFPTGYDPEDLTYNDTIIYNNQTVFIWELQKYVDEGLIQFYGKGADYFSYVANGTATPNIISNSEITGEALSYYGGYYFAAVYNSVNPIYLLQSTDLITWTTKVSWSPAGTVVVLSFTIDENGIVYFAYIFENPSETFTWRYRDFDLVGNVWKTNEATFISDTGSHSCKPFASVFTTPDGSKQWYTANRQDNLYCLTRDGWSDTTFTSITVYDPSAGYGIRWADVTHYFNSSSGTHWAYFIFATYHTTPANMRIYGAMMNSSDAVLTIETVVSSWLTNYGQCVAATFDPYHPTRIMVSYSVDASLCTIYNSDHGLGYNANWAGKSVTTRPLTFGSTGQQMDLGYLNGHFALIYSAYSTFYPTCLKFNVTAGTWESPVTLWNYATKSAPDDNNLGMFFFRRRIPSSTEWIVVDLNGTVILIIDDPDDVIDVFPPDPWDPGDDGGPFSRFKMRLYFLVVGLFLFTGPIIFLATRPEGAIWYLVAPVVMLIGVAIMASITLI